MAAYSIVNGVHICNSSSEGKFGRLTIIGPRFFRVSQKVVCECDCGVIKAVCYYGIAAGKIKSCGCLNAEKIKQSAKTHGLSSTHEYNCWRAMVERCNKPQNSCYSYYGGRGIKVHADWVGRGGFERWLNHIGQSPTEKHTQDRIDVNGNYEPGNVRWATRKEQSSNQRERKTCRRLVAFGVEKTISEWSNEYGVKYTAIMERLRRGWTPENAVSGKIVVGGISRKTHSEMRTA